MEEEIIIYQTQLNNLFNPFVIMGIVAQGYNKTDCKFSVSFNGSKGYLSNISIYAEGYQKENNRLRRDELFTRKNRFTKKKLNVFFSHVNGVRLSLGNDEPIKYNSIKEY